MKKIRKIIPILLLICILTSNISTIFAKSICESEKVNLVFDHDCVSVLRIKGTNMLKQVAYVCYKDPDTGIKYPAFCVEPDKEGIGTGAGDSYDVTLSALSTPILWRMLYKGYVGSSYTSWGLECDDDLYFATKAAVHCFADGTTPVTKYEIPHRVGHGDNVSLEEVQRRGAKVLEVAQAIYDYAYNSSENYIKASVSVSKREQTEISLGGTKYLAQNFNVNANKELTSYNVSILGFPDGTRILNSSNNDSASMSNSTFKIAIPIKSIVKNFVGYINVTDAKVKTFPIFYANSGNDSTQNYIITDPSETSNARTTLDVDAYKSTLKIIKSDSENKEAIAGAVFNVKYADGTNIGDYTTDKNGTITISKLRQGKVIVTEKSVPSNYVLDSSSKDVVLEYNSSSTLSITNDKKKGSVKVIKYDKDNNEIRLSDVEFKLYNEQQKEIGTYKTDKNGEIYIENLDIGKYTLKETETNVGYDLTDDITFIVEYKKTTTLEVDNEQSKGQVQVIKIDADYNNIPLKDVVFHVLDENKNFIEEIKTDEQGIATTSRLPSYNKTYYLQEVETNQDYILDKDLHKFTIVKDKVSEIVIENKHQEGNLQIYKVDKDNHRITLGGVKFSLYSVEFNKIVGNYTTDLNGEIKISNLRVGNYILKETNKKNGYKLAKDIKIEIKANETNNITVENELEKGQIKVIKVDKDNNTIFIPDTKFEILDENKNYIETITTNENGEAYSSLLPSYNRLYYIHEIEANKDYVLNDKQFEIGLTVDKTSEIKIENERIKGKVEITKVDSKDENKKLESAKFGVYDEKDNLIETIVTNKDGIATSSDLYKGKYYLKELDTGSKYYLLNENTFEFEIVNNGEIIKKTIENEPTDITVDVDKIGTAEIMPGNDVNYIFSNVANNSNIYLDNFKWFDYIPTDYIRLQKMTTGKWNQDLTYKVYYKTNKSNEYILFKENLKTDENYDLDFSQITLEDDEYIIETMFDFGKVEKGFRESISPTMTCKSFDTLKDNDVFTNKTKTVGTYFDVTSEADSTWTTITHVPEKPHEPVLPRTGK